MSPGVAANFAQQDLEHLQMVTRITWALDQFDLKADQQSIEVLESVVVHKSDTKVYHAIDQLAKLGCTIDLDDFGIVQITIQFAVPVQG
jgi:predicted signal transduction protein with EAL and GGDEF domain